MIIQYHRVFLKQHRKTPASIRQKFEKRLRLFVKDPFHLLLRNHRLSGDREGQRSINVTGDWRAVYEMKNSHTVVFLEIGTHDSLYKK